MYNKILNIMLRSISFQLVTVVVGWKHLLNIYDLVNLFFMYYKKFNYLMSDNPNLRYAQYPVYPELRCGSCGTTGTRSTINNQVAGVAYKNGKPYDCKCNIVSAPYSMPYDASGCKQCQPPYQAACNHASARCTCHHRATLYNNNMYEAFNFPGKWY